VVERVVESSREERRSVETMLQSEISNHCIDIQVNTKAFFLPMRFMCVSMVVSESVY
jgi:hypothetical protein